MSIEILRNETEVKNEIFETEREIANKILFSSAPKNHGKNSIKENDLAPYYDATYYAKVSQISQLKNKVLFLKSQLEEIEENHAQEEHEISSNINAGYNNTISNTAAAFNNKNANNIQNNLNYRVNDLNSDNINNIQSNIQGKIEINNAKNNRHDRSINNRNKNSDLHLFIIINNDTFPHKLADMESKLSQNSHNYTEKNIGYEDLIKEQLQSVDKVYAQRKDKLASFNNEMKTNLKDVHDKK